MDGTIFASHSFRGDGMKVMQNAILTIFSFGTYLCLALWQTATTAIGDLTIVKDVGMGGAFIATCFFMFRYFASQIEKKETANEKLQEKVMQMAEKAIQAETASKETTSEVLELLKDLQRKL